jgi:hypothetical protein
MEYNTARATARLPGLDIDRLEIAPELGANFVIALAVVTISRSDACEVMRRFNIPYEYVRHVRRLVQFAA